MKNASFCSLRKLKQDFFHSTIMPHSITSLTTTYQTLPKDIDLSESKMLELIFLNYFDINVYIWILEMVLKLMLYKINVEVNIDLTS